MKKDLITKIKTELRIVADKDKAKILSRFFKTDQGEYGEGDKFLGVVVPEQRKIAKMAVQGFTTQPIALNELKTLIESPWHEERLTALLILVELYRQVDQKTKKAIFNFYLNQLRFINNWDLVDLSASSIVGDYLFSFYLQKQTRLNLLLKLARSKNLWSRRVAILATFPFIKNHQFFELSKLTDFLLFQSKTEHDLICKALGWMWREVGQRDRLFLKKFLNEKGTHLPRVTLRYSIEKFSPTERKKYLKLKQKHCP